MRGFRWALAPLLLLALAAALAGCAWSPVAPYAGNAPKRERLYLIASGWHTEVGLPAEAMSGALAALHNASPQARFFVFGWGERAYYMNPDPGLGALLAGAVPASSVLLVIPLTQAPEDYFSGATVLRLPVSSGGLDRLSHFLSDYLEKDAAGAPRRIGGGPDPGSAFYASKGTYSLGNTCNTWTAEALRASGLPVDPAGIVFAHEVVDQVRKLAAR